MTLTKLFPLSYVNAAKLLADQYRALQDARKKVDCLSSVSNDTYLYFQGYNAQKLGEFLRVLGFEESEFATKMKEVLIDRIDDLEDAVAKKLEDLGVAVHS